MKIIVLGATGQIGKVVFDNLKTNKNYHVVGTTRRATNGLLRFDLFRDDWSLLGKVQVLINCIGQINESKGSSFDHIHLGVTKKIIDNREIIGNPRIIQISALGASSDHTVRFLNTKGKADEFLSRNNNTIIVRPSIVCTHRTMLVKKMMMVRRWSRLTAGLVFLPKGFADHKIQPVMPEDLASIIEVLCLAESVPPILNVCGPERLTFRSIIETMFNVRTMNFKIIEIRKAIVDKILKFIIQPLFPSVINNQQYDLLFSDNVADKSEAEKYLGKPLTSTKEFWKNEFI